jgi:hypothetical protein
MSLQRGLLNAPAVPFKVVQDANLPERIHYLLQAAASDHQNIGQGTYLHIPTAMWFTELGRQSDDVSQ